MAHWLAIVLLVVALAGHAAAQDNTTVEAWSNVTSVDWIGEHFDANSDGLLDEEEFEAYYFHLFPELEHDHDEHTEEGHSEEEEHTEEGGHTEEEGHTEEGEHTEKGHTEKGGHTDKREEVDDDHHEVDCPSPDELFGMWDLDGNALLDSDEVRMASTDMLIMLQLGCGELHHEEEECEPPTSAERWGYGTLAAVIISLISVVGIVTLPINNASFKTYFVLYSTSFAVGALVADVILHILPLVWGIHGHEEEAGHSDHAEEEEESLSNDEVLLRGLVVGAGLGLFYLLEVLVRSLCARYSSTAAASTDVEMQSKGGDNDDHHHHHNHLPGDHHSLVPVEPVKHFSQIKPIGWLNLLSDAMHNFSDGLALGAAFSISLSTGLATAIAIGCHEIPQEFADFGILLHSGFSKLWAIGFNLLCGCICIIGTFIGLGIGEAAADAEVWILAVTAGGFLYIALAEMLPFLVNANRSLRRAFEMFFFALLGWFILFIIAWYEDQLGGCDVH